MPAAEHTCHTGRGCTDDPLSRRIYTRSLPVRPGGIPNESEEPSRACTIRASSVPPVLPVGNTRGPPSALGDRAAEWDDRTGVYLAAHRRTVRAILVEQMWLHSILSQYLRGQARREKSRTPGRRDVRETRNRLRSRPLRDSQPPEDPGAAGSRAACWPRLGVRDAPENRPPDDPGEGPALALDRARNRDASCESVRGPQRSLLVWPA